MNTITQTNLECKPFVYPKILPGFSDVILESSNEKASDILQTHGEINMLPSVPYVTLEETARLYNVKEKYILGVLTRRGITIKTHPDDFFKIFRYDFVRRFGLSADGVVRDAEHSDRTVACQRVGGKCYRMPMPKERVIHMLSARLVLALAPMLYFRRYTGRDNNAANQLMAALERSSYAEEGHKREQARVKEECRRREERRQCQLEYEMAQAARTQTSEYQETVELATVQKPELPVGIPVTANGDLVLSPEMLLKVTHTVVKDTVSEMVSVMRPNEAPDGCQQPAQEDKTTQVPVYNGYRRIKPDNWDVLAELYQAGAITQSEFSDKTGIPRKSLYYYLRKWSGTAKRKQTG